MLTGLLNTHTHKATHTATHTHTQKDKLLRSFAHNVLVVLHEKAIGQLERLRERGGEREGEEGGGGERERGKQCSLTCSLCPSLSTSRRSERLRIKMISSREKGDRKIKRRPTDRKSVV